MKSNLKAAALGAICGAGLVTALRISVFAAERTMLRTENREMRRIWDTVKNGGYEGCFNGVHEGIEGSATPYVSDKVFHWNCRISHCRFVVQGNVRPNGYKIDFINNQVIRS